MIVISNWRKYRLNVTLLSVSYSTIIKELFGIIYISRNATQFYHQKILIQFIDRKTYPFYSILMQFETNSKSSRESERQLLKWKFGLGSKVFDNKRRTNLTLTL